MDELIGANQKTRRRFACTVYLITIILLSLALGQWVIVNLIKSIGDVFKKYEWISVICFFLAILLFVIFIIYEKIRVLTGVNWLITVLIVEFGTIGLFALVVKSHWPDLLLWFGVCLLMQYIFILIGVVIPLDVTMFIVTLLVVAFEFIVLSVFWIVLFMFHRDLHYFLFYQTLLSIITLTFVIYHAQTITGGRFGEMRLTDYLLGALILYFDFVVLFLMTFYMQIFYHIPVKF